MSSCVLTWSSDRGFELDLDVGDDEVTLRMAKVPVPADGTAELSGGVALHHLEILFKGQAELDGEPGQIQSARVALREGALSVEVEIEDMETGDIVRWEAEVPVQVPAHAPARGGPRPAPPEEDELDWDDETTLEKLIVDAPPASATPERKSKPPESGPRAATGIQRLLNALSSLDDDEPSSDDEADAFPPPVLRAPASRPPAPASRPPAPVSRLPSSVPAAAGRAPPPKPPVAGPSAADLTAEDEARRFVAFLIERESLALEDDEDAETLTSGVARVLSGHGNPDRKARALSKWLIDQPAVAELYVDDDELASILDQW